MIGLRQVEGKTMGEKRKEKSSDKREGGGSVTCGEGNGKGEEER